MSGAGVDNAVNVMGLDAGIAVGMEPNECDGNEVKVLIKAGSAGRTSIGAVASRSIEAEAR